MSIQTRPFGHMPNGEPVTEYILTNQNGLTATFLDLGGIWRQMLVPDREGRMEDVVPWWAATPTGSAAPPWS